MCFLLAINMALTKTVNFRIDTLCPIVDIDWTPKETTLCAAFGQTGGNLLGCVWTTNVQLQ